MWVMPLRAQQQVEVGGVERALARLVDDQLAVDRGDLGDDLPARLAAHQDPPARAVVADARADVLRAPQLVRRAVGQVGPVALAGVDDQPAGGAHRGEHLGRRLEPGAGQVEVVAHGVDVAARPAEVDLPVDADQRGVRRVDRRRRRARCRGRRRRRRVRFGHGRRSMRLSRGSGRRTAGESGRRWCRGHRRCRRTWSGCGGRGRRASASRGAQRR